MTQKRIGYIDFLKFIGLTGIIIAHTGAPGWIMAFRNFDVPMMVILSSIVNEKSYSKRIQQGSVSAGSFLISRIKRLVAPTWIFLVLYFSLDFFLGVRRENRYYAYSFLLTRYGIGYVWIVLIYLFSALLIPVFKRMGLRFRSVLVIAAVYCAYELAWFFQIGTGNKLFHTVFYYIIPYGVLTYLGCGFHCMNCRTKKGIAAVALAVFIAIGAHYWLESGLPQSTQINKYPPRLYYLCYGVAWSFFLLVFCEEHMLKVYSNRLVVFIAQHSMWIYLWHILMLRIYDELHLPGNWILKLIAVYSTSIALVAVINRALDAVEKHGKLGILGYFRG